MSSHIACIWRLLSSWDDRLPMERCNRVTVNSHLRVQTFSALQMWPINSLVTVLPNCQLPLATLRAIRTYVCMYVDSYEQPRISVAETVKRRSWSNYSCNAGCMQSMLLLCHLFLVALYTQGLAYVLGTANVNWNVLWYCIICMYVCIWRQI